MKSLIFRFALFVWMAPIFAQPTDGNAFERGHNKDWSRGVQDTPETTGRTRESTPADDRIERAEHVRSLKGGSSNEPVAPDKDTHGPNPSKLNLDWSGTGIIDPATLVDKTLSNLLGEENEREYDRTKGPLRDTKCDINKADGNRMALAREIVAFTNYYANRIDIKNGANLREVDIRTLQRQQVMFDNVPYAFGTSFARAPDHELERKKSKPGPHVSSSPPGDYGLPSKIEGQYVHDWRDPNYDREKTQLLIDVAFAIDPGLAKERNFFNDPHVFGVTPYQGHSNHVHIGFSNGPLSEAAQEYLRTGNRAPLAAAIKAIQQRRNRITKRDLGRRADFPQTDPSFFNADEELDDSCDRVTHHKTPLEMYKETTIDDQWITDAIQQMKKNQEEQRAAAQKK